MDDANNTTGGPADGGSDTPAPQPPAPAPQPPAPQPPAPGAAPTPPPQAPQQYAATAAPQAAAKPKSNKTLYIILGIVAVLVLCGVAACAIGGATYLGTQQNKEEAIETAETHMVAALTIAEEIENEWAAFSDAGLDQSPEAYDQLQAETQTKIGETRAELDAAQAAIDELPDSTFKTEYTFAISSLHQALDAYELLYADLAGTMALSGELETIGTQIEAAQTKLDDAVTSNNDDEYSSGKTQAEAAKKSFDTITARFNELHAQHPDAELDKLAAIGKKNAEKASYVIQAADAGKAGRISEYNDLTDKYNDTNTEVTQMPLPSWADDASLLMGRAEALNAEAQELIAVAEESYDAAWAAYDAGDY